MNSTIIFGIVIASASLLVIITKFFCGRYKPNPELPV